MANPRKFSEKIALHTQKQAEETAAFEEIMREVMGATRVIDTPTTKTYSNQLQITPSFSASRAGSLPNVNQIGQHNVPADGKNSGNIDLHGCLTNLEEIKNGCLERSGSVRAESSSRRNVSPMSRSPHRHHSSQNLAATPTNASYNNVNTNHLQFSNSTHHKRSQSPYLTNNAYLSPPPPDGHWRRTNSDSALHQSALSASTNQTLDSFNQLIGNTGFNGNTNGSPHRTAAMVIDNSGNNITFHNGTAAQWESARSMPNSTDKFLLGASLPDQQLRPRSCEVPGINIYPSQDDNNSESLGNHHHIPISSNTGSLPDLTNLHFPVPLHAIDGDEQNAANGMHGGMISVSAGPNSPYSNGPDSPFSPGSSHNSNLSPPPPCNMMGNYATSPSHSPRRQTSPGPSPSPTSSRRKAHHNVNNLVIGGQHRQHQQQQAHQTQSQVCYPPQHTPQHTPPHIPPRAPSYLNESSPQQYTTRYKSPPRITVEGLALDTSALSLNNGTGNGNGMQYNQNSNSENSMLSNQSCGSPFQQQQFHFNTTQSFQNFSMGMHRSTTPTDSCSAPTSPASQNISPSNSPELPINTNGGGNTSISNQQFSNSYNSYSNQQANILQHQLEQFRMTNDSDSSFMMSCGSDLASPLQSNANAFYLDSLNSASVSLSQYNDPVISQPNSNEMPSSPHQISSHNVAFTNENVYFASSQMSPMSSISNSASNLYKTEIPTSMNVNSMYNNQHQQLSNSSHCTTPQTPSSIPDIILTGPNLDDLQSTSSDIMKDLNNTMVNMNNSFDSDIFCSASDDLRPGTFDSFDLDNLPILTDIDTNTE